MIEIFKFDFVKKIALWQKSQSVPPDVELGYLFEKLLIRLSAQEEFKKDAGNMQEYLRNRQLGPRQPCYESR